MIDPVTMRAEIDLDAYAANLRQIVDHVAPAQVMAVVKADGYGHGMLACARRARAAGIAWLGVATPGEALALRADGDDGRLLCWLYGPDEDLSPVIAADIDISAQSVEEISRITAAAAVAESTARVHLKIDTGLSRNGATIEQWPEVCAAAAEAVAAGAVDLVGIWSHLAASETPDHPSVTSQQQVFEEALAVAEQQGLRPSVRHLANSGAALGLPELHYDLVRVGIASYGLDPGVGVAERAGVTLRPVMRLVGQVIRVKKLATGAGVAYGHTWHAPEPVTVALVPLGYADGIPRAAGNTAAVTLGGQTCPIRGVICMDQFVVEAPPGTRVGDEVVLWGDGTVTVDDWARACSTINYELVTRIGVRVPRVIR